MTHPTKLQLKVLLYIKSHLQKHRKFPTPPQIASHFGWASDNTARAHLKALLRKGRLKKTSSAGKAEWTVSVN